MIKSEIQLVRSLGEKRSRSELGLFVAEGEKFISELAGSKLRVRKVYQTERCSEDFSDVAEVEWIAESEMARISQLKSSTTVLALVEMPQYEIDFESLKGSLTLVLDGVQNPGNLGTIIRLADWFGIDNVVCSPSCADSFNPKVVQATMGAILRVKVHYTPLEPFLESAAGCGLPIYGALLQGGENIYESELAQSGVVVMGSEGQGISSGVEALVTNRVFIPPFPAENNNSESLNVAVATAIICSEFRRR